MSSPELSGFDLLPDPPPPRKPRFTWVRLLQVVGGLALAVGLLGWALPYFAHTTWADVWAVLRGIPVTTAFGLFLLMVLGLWLYTFTFTGSLPHLPHVKAFIVNVCGSAVGNLLPAGGAAGAAATYKQLRSWGFSRRAISTSLIVTGVWNLMARLLLPILGIVLMIFFAGDLNPAVMRAAAIGAVGGIVVLGVFITMLASERACHGIGGWLERTFRFLPFVQHSEPSLSQHILDQRHQTIAVVRHGWLSMTFGLVGFFVVPVVGLFLGFVLGVYLAERGRLGQHRAAWASTIVALKAAGWSMLIELLTGLVMAATWVIALLTA